MPSMKKSSLIPVVLILGAGWAYGQKPPTAKPTVPTKQEPTKPKEGYADLDMEDSKTNNKTGITTGRNFTYREKDTVITGQKAQYNRDEKRLLAEGSLVLNDPEHHVVGDKADVDNSAKKLAIITGSCLLYTSPSPRD